MNELEKFSTGFLHAADELRQLLIDNPGLPLVVLAGEDANSGDYSTMFCGAVRACKGEFLDCMQKIDDCRAYTDRDDFAEDVADHLYDLEGDDFKGTDEEWDQHVAEVVAEYDPYWKDCIIVTVDN